jgi:hypothetical protein
VSADADSINNINGIYDADGDGNLVNCLGGLDFDNDDHLELVRHIHNAFSRYDTGAQN